MVSFFMRSVTFAWYCGRLNSRQLFFLKIQLDNIKHVPLKLLQFSCKKKNKSSPVWNN